MRSRRAPTLAFAMVAAACSELATEPSESTELVAPITALPRALSLAEQTVIGSSNRFGMDLLRTIWAATPDSTVFVSPLSASMALGMTMNGAAGETLAQMRRVLGFEELTAEGINASYRDLIALLGGLDSRVDFRLANAIFHRDSFQMETPYLDLVRLYYGARLEGLDFNAPQAVDHINAWVREATEDRIDEMVEWPIDPMTVAFLLNAIYFKGDWANQFDPDDTYSGRFDAGGGEAATVRYMTQVDTLPYRVGNGWHAADLPYGGGAWSMTIAVPRAAHGLEGILGDLESILDPAARWSVQGLEVHVPRFELERERVLTEDLKALGMVHAFHPLLADFTPMHRFARYSLLHIKEVKQKTFLRVDEEGTEAAAVTSVEMTNQCACGPPVFRADRPFLIAIRERISGTILFVGLIVQAPEG